MDFSDILKLKLQLLWFPCRSCTSPVPACSCNALPGPEWQPPLHRPPTGLSSSQSAGSVCAVAPPIGSRCLSASAGHYSGPGGGAGSRTPQTGQLPVHPGGSPGSWEAAECRQRRVAQVTVAPPSLSNYLHPPSSTSTLSSLSL